MTQTVTVKELKAQLEAARTAIFAECGVFFAFDNQQFESNKTPLAEGDKYVRFMSGGYMPKSKYSLFESAFDTASATYWNAINSNNLRPEVIHYELNNHECYYDGDWSRAKEVLPADYTEAEIRAVYAANVDKYDF
jgi:hypothetical protein